MSAENQTVEQATAELPIQALLQQLKIHPHAPFGEQGAPNNRGDHIQAARDQIDKALQTMVADTNLPLGPNQALKITYDVRLPMRDKPLLQMEMTPRNTNLDTIAKMMDVATRCVLDAYVDNINASIIINPE
ncbi:hypothetical protein O0I10_010546 [Lichtheimia ornata]|uniref:Uncharacterized protein n=1 Tax=Lichtheimia ornata TaxID=688661 RepID=A0AAD7UW19_9FUNG|nr:uncharacterized protein O0I10_010546 [Lichtheimia ornata]KAJ8653747.1 hypothetical protein O0I10_010546 [Lichtheimia ornata]